MLLNLILCIGVTAWAAKDPLVTPAKVSAEEILSLPEMNRHVIAKKQSSELYSELLSLSQNSKKNIGLRWKAVTLAAHLNPTAAQTDLKPLLKSDEWFMRNAALVGLTSKKTKQSHEIAIGMLRDKALVIRSAAVMALAPEYLSQNETREELWEELEASYNFRNKQSLWVRAQILDQLSKNAQRRERELFVKALKDRDNRLHAPAIIALEKISDKKLGLPKATLAEKKKLWLKWASSAEAQSVF